MVKKDVGRELFDIVASGKKPPASPETEQAILGAVMIEKDAFGIVSRLIDENDFYEDRHQLIFRSFERLAKRRMAIDLLTVREELMKMGVLESVGDVAYLAELTNKVGSAANIEFHAVVVKEKAYLRRAILGASEILKLGYGKKVDAGIVRDYLEKWQSELVRSVTKNETTHISNGVKELLQDLDSLKNSKGDHIGAECDLWEVDDLISGFCKEDLTILAARPGMGKTSLALSIVKGLSENGYSSEFFSLEMSKAQLAVRMIAMESGVDSRIVKNSKKWTPEIEAEIMEAANKVSEYSIRIDDTPAIGLREIASKLRRDVKEHGIKVVVIDYLQLMGTDKIEGNRDEKIGYITRGLKALAKELKISIVLLSQLSRETTRRGDKRPELSDLRESGNIEQDADNVLFVHRPEYYMKDKKKVKDEGLEGVAEIIGAKIRHGECKTVYLLFDSPTTEFRNRKSKPRKSKDEGDDLPF